MKRLIKFFKRNIYFIAGIAYLALITAGFLFVLSFVARTIDKSLPGGSEVFVPQIAFDLEKYETIQDVVGVSLKEEVAPFPLTPPLPKEEAPSVEEPPLGEEGAGEKAESGVIEAPPFEPEPTVEIEAPPPVLDKSSISIFVLNGSSVTGAAGRLRSSLEADGFSVPKVGNAVATQKSRLEIKESKKEYEDLIRKIIEQSYTIHEVRVLEEGETADAIFIIGIETKKEEVGEEEESEKVEVSSPEPAPPDETEFFPPIF